jgi:hypothetical protein
MYPKTRFIELLFTVWLLTLTIAAPARAQTPTQTPAPEPPPGFYLVDSAYGIQLYKKDYPNGNPDYIQVVDLGMGARLELLHGNITELRPAKGVYGGADPRFTSLPVQTYYSQVASTDKDLFCVTNGLFFYMPEYPTRLAFPLKVDGTVVTDGWGIDTYPDQKLLLELWGDHADITDLTQQSLYGSTAPDLLGGLTEEANKRMKYSVARTFVGVADRDQSGSYETVLVFNSASSLQSGAADVLRSFGAEKVMMLDGGGSTQLKCKSGWYIRSDRPVPQALAVISAPPPPISSQLVSHTDWPVVVEGDSLSLQIVVQNTGVVSWTQTAPTISLRTERLEFERRFNLDQPVAPGQTVTITQSLAGFSQNGASSALVEWSLEYQGKQYPGQTIQLNLVVIPAWLREHKSELVAQIDRWRLERPTEIRKLVAQWLNQNRRTQMDFLGIEGMQRVRPLDAAIVPLVMLPVMAFLALVIYRLHR